MLKSLSRQLNTDVTSPTLDLKRIFVLRNILLATAVIIMTISHLALTLQLPAVQLTVVIALLAVFNVFTYMRMRRHPQISEMEFFMQLSVDVIFLTVMLYYTGGATNPFVSFFLLPLAIIAATLRQKYAWLMAILSISCYTLLMFVYIPLPHIEFDHHSDFGLHIFGMWFGFIIGAGLIVMVVAKMANILRERERILADTREKMLHDEHLVALGTMATGAAHELGTPLATMAVITKELEHDYSDSPALVGKVKLLRQQIDRCKDTLSVLSEKTGQIKADSGCSYTIDQYLEKVLFQWRSMRPTAQVQHHWNGILPAPRIVADESLSQAFINLLNNAADASIDNVEVEGHWDSHELVFEVRDSGDGFNHATFKHVGKPFFTTKPDGLGLGLFLVQAVINRFGGSLNLLNRDNGGGCTRIKLPLEKLLVTPV
jgi:two-component system, sensor histidine kinase RegB